TVLVDGDAQDPSLAGAAEVHGLEVETEVVQRRREDLVEAVPGRSSGTGGAGGHYGHRPLALLCTCGSVSLASGAAAVCAVASRHVPTAPPRAVCAPDAGAGRGPPARPGPPRMRRIGVRRRHLRPRTLSSARR